MRPRTSIRVQIGELVVDGLAPDDVGALRAAVEREVARALGARGLREPAAARAIARSVERASRKGGAR